MLIIDAHEDLAWNMLTFGRDYTQSVAQTRAREAETGRAQAAGEALIGWPDWVAGEVGIVFATLYATPASHQGGWAEVANKILAGNLAWRRLKRSRVQLETHLPPVRPWFRALRTALADLSRHPSRLAGATNLVSRKKRATPSSDCCREDDSGEHTYRSGEEAHRVCSAQLQVYHQLVEAHPDKFYLITSQADLAQGIRQWRESPEARRVGLVLLMEGADAVRHPAELAAWHAGGLRIVGPAWARTRYAGGTGEPGPLTDAGRALLRQMAELGMILDLSHMTDEGVSEALDIYPGSIIASHSNARALLPSSSPERHLSDETIRRLAGRQGVIGVMLYNEFLKDGVKPGDPRQLVGLAEVVAQIDHYCQLVGHARHLGLGSDFDGGFGLADVPVGLDSIADLGRIGQALDRRGYNAADVEAILGGNWLGLLQRALPER